jgi:hypothetical protein
MSEIPQVHRLGVQQLEYSELLRRLGVRAVIASIVSIVV